MFLVQLKSLNIRVSIFNTNNSIDLSDSKEDDKKDEETTTTLSMPQELSISEQKQVSESLKSELFVEQEVVQSVQTDKVQHYQKAAKINCYFFHIFIKYWY